ncbi:MAG: hypothetical protein DMG37_00165 [Acidobacteria bacterium]|nr:MAG: hypothetical protein DMG37_00165 [Acidobacteriota bacterium]
MDSRIFSPGSCPAADSRGPSGDASRRTERWRGWVRGAERLEIAAHLGLSPQSVKVYVSNLLRKSGVSNRSGLAHYAVVRTLARTQPPTKVA